MVEPGPGNASLELKAEVDAALALRDQILRARQEGQGTWRGIALDPLFAPGGGKMFGVMRALDGAQEVWRYAFSGQIQRAWILPGWAPPLFEVARWLELEQSYDRKLKALTEAIRRAPVQTQGQLKLERKALSHELLDAYLNLYEVPALNGARAGIRALFGGKRPPTGTGDCCAPKLLAMAAREKLTLLGLSEIFIGASPRSANRVCGEVSTPCVPKCVPLLDFMLCPKAEDRA